MLRFLLLIPMVAILLHLGLIYESTGFLLLAFSLAVVGLVSFCILLFQAKRVCVEFSVPLKLAQKGQAFSIKARISVLSGIPVGGLKLFVRYGMSKGRKEGRLCLKSREAERGENLLTATISLTEAGYYEFALQNVRIYDPFGLFYLNGKKKKLAHVMIFPDIAEVPVALGERVRHFYGETTTYDELLAGRDPSETFGIREFREGDNLRRIHWKLSVRTGELMVKEDSLPKSCSILLFMPQGNRIPEGSLDYMASLSYTLMDRKCGHFVVWYSEGRGELVRARVEEEEGFYSALTAYLRDMSGKGGEDRLEQYRERYRAEQYLHSVEALERGGISVDGGEAVGLETLREELLLN